jgi:hypothetical protein
MLLLVRESGGNHHLVTLGQFDVGAVKSALGSSNGLLIAAGVDDRGRTRNPPWLALAILVPPVRSSEPVRSSSSPCPFWPSPPVLCEEPTPSPSGSTAHL